MLRSRPLCLEASAPIVPKTDHSSSLATSVGGHDGDAVGGHDGGAVGGQDRGAVVLHE